MHKLDKAEYDKRKAAKEELKQPHTPPASVAALRARVDLLETVLGVKPLD